MEPQEQNKVAPPQWILALGLPERFLDKIVFGTEEECWPWTAATYEFGYGVFRLSGRNVTASRWLYQQIHGPLPLGMCVCHSCDNPPCCNPAHFFVGTRGDNNRDMFSKGRRPTALGEQNGKSVLTTEIVREIRSTYTGKRGEFKDLCLKYGVHKGTMRAVISGRTWKHVV